MKHLIRMKEEKNALQGKLDSLKAFLGDVEQVKKLDPNQFSMMNLQLFLMNSYINVLNARIEYDTAKGGKYVE